MSDNIKVVVKIRPLISREVDQKLPYAWRVQNDTLYQIDHHGRDAGACYTFDKVYDKDTKTLKVYNDVAKPIVEAAIAGFNGTIFAYGQTSSGKTYTMSGTDENPGIIPLAVWDLYDNIKKIPDRDFLVRVSYIEIYNETLKDLLNIDNKNIKIRDTYEGGVKVDATEKVTCTPQEVLEIMKMGEANRQTGATNMNEESSRSHSIFQITIESREHIEDENEAGCVNVSTLNLVDLAGSERSGQTGATGVRFKEGTHINKSLSVLALVIRQLSDDPNKSNKYVNYRDSKLTRILQNSLGGNAKTSIICAVTPASIEETVSTLQFANRAKAIKNKPEVNAVATDATMIQSLTKQLSRLQSELASKKNIEQDNANLQKQIENLHKMILNGFGQRSVVTGGKQKVQQLRRKTISTLHPQEEDPDPIVPKFCTPALKYNPMAFSTDFLPIQSSTKLTTVPEEVRLITPPPLDRKVSFQTEILEIDSDEETSNQRKPDVPTCSPVHSCYESSKTPPCILRKNAKMAEQNLKDLEELTAREKIYTPEVVELIEKLEHKASIISKLEDELDTLNKDNKEKDGQLQLLKEKVDAVEQEIKSVTSAKSLLEAQCKEYHIKLIDFEVSYDTLKKKSKTREDELLSLLEENVGAKKACGDSEIMPLNVEKNEIFGSETPTDILALKAFLKECGIAQTVDSEIATQIQDLVMNSQTELNIKNQLVLDLENTILNQKEKIESLEMSCQQLQTMVDCFKDKLANIEGENDLLKSSVENLNTTVELQKNLLETANDDMKKCNNLINDLRVKLSKMEVPDTKINDSMLESLIVNEENFIANNENMRNIIQSFKMILNMKSKEINESKKLLQENSDLSNKNKDLTEQLENKEQQINMLVNQVEKMGDQLSENTETINMYVQREQENTDKLNDIEKKNDSLHNLNEHYAKQIKNLKDHNEQILSSLSEKEANYQEALVKIDDLTQQIEDLSHRVADYGKEINAQKDLIESLTNKETNMQASYTEAKTYLDKVRELTLALNGDDFEIPEKIDANDSFLNYLSNSLSYLEVATKTIVQEKRQINLNIKNLEDELSEIQTHSKMLSQDFNEIAHQNKKLTEQVMQLTNEVTVTRNELEVKNREVTKKEIELNEARENNKHLQNEVLSKENNISCLQENVASLDLEIQNLLKAKEELIIFSKEVEELKNILKVKEDSYTELLKSKENEMAEALTNSFAEQSKLLKATKELNDALENRNYLLGIIMDKASKIKVNYDIHDTVSNGHDENENFEHILHTLDKIANYLETVSSVNTENKNAKDLLLEAQTQISELSRQNLELMNECSEIERKNQDLLNELNMVKIINADLSASGALLDLLKVELKTKSEELVTMESKIRIISSEVSEQDHLLKVEKDNIQNDKLKVKELQFQAQAQFTNQLDFEKTEEKETLYKTEPKSPMSLQTISLNKVIECLLTNDPKSPSVTTSNSSLNILNSNVNSHPNVCECISLALELTEAKKKILQLNNHLKQLQEINNNLVQEHEAVRQEIQLLVEPANELQKKITNHRTNLSTLTATTYAENKLLHSQLRVLKHHHKRYVHVCQRDLPGFRSQLNELMAILRNSAITDKHNNSFKRYSLPDVLDNNTTNSTLKNDSTFDGDLLMLDTNITVTTTDDNTLVGTDQMCLDITQTDCEEACNTNDVSKVLDPRIVYSQIVDIANDNQRIYEKVKQLEVENQRLREQAAKCMSSSVNLNKGESSNLPSVCKKCEDLEQLKHKVGKLQEDIKNLSEDLSLTKSLKEETEKKYNDLLLELPSSEALVKKLNVLEKEHNAKLQEINKLSCDLTKKTRALKVLQEENDTLSNEIMDKVSETDDLTKELNLLKETLNNLNKELELAKSTDGGNKSKDSCHRCTYEVDALNEKNIKLSQELEELMIENAKIKQATNCECSQCAVKDELIMSLQNSSETHSKLNRSISDSHNTSRANKFCTLQNELHASKEDCKKITEEVTTIKHQLERSNISLGQSMDLDESMGDGNIFNFTKHFATVEQQMDKFCLPHIAEENPLDIYTVDKTDCFNFFAEKTGTDKENLNYDMKILDVFKMLYNNILTKHANEVENLINKLKDFEESKIVLQAQIQNLTAENTKITNDLERTDNIRVIVDVFSQIKENINSISLAVSAPPENKHTDVVLMFKEHLLEVLDSQFGLSTVKVFDSLISKILSKNQCELSEIINKYSQLQGEMESILEEFSAVTSNLNELKSQLSHKESEYNLLKSQKERVHEICSAVTLDIIQRDKELSSTIDNVCKKLYDMNLIHQNDVDVTLSLSKTVNTLFERLMKEIESKNTFIQENQNLLHDINQSETILKQKDRELELLKAEISEKENKLHAQKTLHEDLNRIYESKLEENTANIELIEKLTEEINVLKTIVSSKENEITAMQKVQSSIDESLKEFEKTIQELKEENETLKTTINAESNSQKQAELSNLLQKVEELNEERQKLVTLNEIFIKEKETCKAELAKCNDIIKVNKIEIEKMMSDNIVLKESVQENVSVIEGLKTEAKSLLEQTIQMKQELDTKSQECSRLEMNIKTHEKTAEIQTKIITRLQNQKAEDEKQKELNNIQLDEMTQKCEALQKEYDELELSLKTSREEIEQLKTLKVSLETRITELETEVDRPKNRLSIEAIAENSRRRRRSLHDSKRLFAEDHCQDPNKLEAVFESRAKPDDLFMDIDDGAGGSNRSSPNRHSGGRDSLHARSDHTEEDTPSRPSSVLGTRRRRQSAHDLRRASLQPDNPLEKLSEDLTNAEPDSSQHNKSEVTSLRNQLASCRRELEQLKDSYRDLDEECETCAQYLRERDEQYLQLKKEHDVLVNQLTETTELLKSLPNRSQTQSQPSFAHASVNTEEDWANLYSVVVDRMSFDAEVEKNKRLTKTVEELRYSKQELKNKIGKLQRALDRHSAAKESRELEVTRSALAACQDQLAELRQRCRELHGEKLAPEEEVAAGGEGAGGGARQRRRGAHDRGRALAHVATETSDDLLSYQVERDNSQSQAQEMQLLKAALDRVRKEKAALEQLAAARALMPPTMYVAAGSGIVQNQQLTDVMKENQKLKKINAKLVNICKKRGKSAHDSNAENEKPEQG